MTSCNIAFIVFCASDLVIGRYGACLKKIIKVKPLLTIVKV